MTDIVERLRFVMRDRFYSMPKVSRTCEDAANEIERLRAELAGLTRDGTESPYPDGRDPGQPPSNP